MLSRVIITARQRLGREQGTVFKDWGGRIPIALVYPNSYRLGMSNLGFQTIYRIINQDDAFVCERSFYEPGGFWAYALESQRPLEDFPVLAFSVSYELDYLHVLETLRAAGLPLFAEDRDESQPLVIAGGPALTANPEPLSPYLDVIAVGEGEVILPPLLRLLKDGLKDRRERLLSALASTPGVYVPLRKGRVIRQWQRDGLPAASVIVTPEAEFRNMYLMEVARGCGWGCRFCLAGFCYRPFRPYPLEGLLLQAGAGLKYTRRLGLVGAAVSEHPLLEELVSALRRRGAEISLSSLRADTLSEPVLKALAESGTRTVTLAPEAGSERLRRVVNKSIPEERILEAVSMVAHHNLPQLKLYFMVGLPSEAEEDIEELIRLAQACQKLLVGSRTRLILQVSSFVPKAGTPFQGQAMAPVALLRERLGRIQKALRPLGIEVRREEVGESLMQAILSRGDAGLGKRLAQVRGASLSAWRQALGDLEELARRPVKRPYPWDFLDPGVTVEYLKQELALAHQGRITPACPPEGCHLCGVC